MRLLHLLAIALALGVTTRAFGAITDPCEVQRPFAPPPRGVPAGVGWRGPARRRPLVRACPGVGGCPRCGTCAWRAPRGRRSIKTARFDGQGGCSEAPRRGAAPRPPPRPRLALHSCTLPLPRPLWAQTLTGIPGCIECVKPTVAGAKHRCHLCHQGRVPIWSAAGMLSQCRPGTFGPTCTGPSGDARCALCDPYTTPGTTWCTRWCAGWARAGVDTAAGAAAGRWFGPLARRPPTALHMHAPLAAPPPLARSGPNSFFDANYKVHCAAGRSDPAACRR